MKKMCMFIIGCMMIISGCSTFVNEYSPTEIMNTAARYGCDIKQVSADGHRERTQVICEDYYGKD